MERVNNKDSWWASDVDSGSLFKVSSNNWTVKLGDAAQHGDSAPTVTHRHRGLPPACRFDTNAGLRRRSTACQQSPMPLLLTVQVITYSYMGLVHADGGPRFPSIRQVHPPNHECDACALNCAPKP